MTQALINELKENNQDFEFYPTTKEMVACIESKLGNAKDVLDIGCGTCNFKKYYKGGISKYFVIEKSKILLQKLDKDAIVLGTDFYSTLLIDKKADTYFCNPPYSEYEQWVIKIIREGNFKKAYLIIPQRWQENEAIQLAIKDMGVRAYVIGEFDFLHAERQARAKVHIVEIDKRKHSAYYGYDNSELKDFEETAFDKWFNEVFKMRDSEKDNKNERELNDIEKEKIKNQLVKSNSKGQLLVELYNAEQAELFAHFKAITSLDVDILKTIGIEKKAVKEAIKQKVKSLKVRYWKIVFDEFEEITSRLTSQTREEMFNKFQELQTVDFTLENIYPLILWVIKNANNYYENQLISFFKKLSSPENVKQYKSNKRVFERYEWRHNCYKNPEELSHYTLDYRIIMSSPFCTDYRGRLDGFNWRQQHALQDIFTIAKNLGFEVGLCDLPKLHGEECTALYKDSDKVFMKYRVYKNGNMHVKFDIEFAKAMNVEVSRLLGWIKNKEDIEKEFPTEMAKGAEKYFKINKYVGLTSNNLLLLTKKGE